MTPELESYIKQAKAGGQTEQQIKAALRSSGWQEADINNAFSPGSAPGGISSVPVGPAATTTAAGWLTGKAIAILVVMALLIIVGIYFAFFKKAPQATLPYSQSQLNKAIQNYAANQMTNNSATGQQSTSTLGQNNNLGTPDQSPVAGGSSGNALPFHCGDLISSADLQNIIGNVSVKEFSSIAGISCFYGFSPNGKNPLEIYAQLAIGANPSSYGNYKLSPSTDVAGVGSQAYSFNMPGPTGTPGPPVLVVLSSNQKYVIQPTVIFQSLNPPVNGNTQTPEDKQKSLQAMIDMAKIVDTNLNSA